MFNFLKHYALWQQALVVGSILMVVVIIFGILIPVLKPKIKKKSMVYLYSFSTGYFIVLALFGLLREAMNTLTDNTKSHSHSIQNIIIISVLVSGILIGMGGGLLFRFVLSKSSGELHIKHEDHSHSDHIFNVSDIDNPRGKWVAILLLLSHRLVAGATLGLLVYNINIGDGSVINETFNVGIILAFILHLVPEVLIIYYRQREAAISQWRAIVNGLLFKFTMIALIVIGAYLGSWISTVYWLMPLFLTTSAAAMSFAAIFELTPEVLDNKEFLNNNWYKIAFTLISSFVIAVAILTIH